MKESKNNLINSVINIINHNDIVTYAGLIEFFAYDCEIYEPDDLVDNANGKKGLEPTAKHILNTDYDVLYDCAILEKDFFIEYLTQRKENIKEIEKDNLEEDILELIENHCISSIEELEEYIVNSGNDTSDDDGGIDIIVARKYATKMLTYMKENETFFINYIHIKNIIE